MKRNAAYSAKEDMSWGGKKDARAQKVSQSGKTDASLLAVLRTVSSIIAVSLR